MRSKKSSVKSLNSINPSSILESNLSCSTNISSKLSQQLLSYYKTKSEKLEKDYENLLELLDQVKIACDVSHEVQRELTENNEQISKLQEIIGELQIHLFREKEQNLKLSAENEELKIEDNENKKRIKALLRITGMCERKFLHVITTCSQSQFIQPQLPARLQKLKEEKQKELTGMMEQNENGNVEPQDCETLLLKNQWKVTQLERQIKMARNQIDFLINEKKISNEERAVERQRFQKEIDFLTAKLKQTQDILCETTAKLVNLQQIYERDKTMWMEERCKYAQTLSVLKGKEGVEVSDVTGYCINGVGNIRQRQNRCKRGKENSPSEEQMIAVYKEQILSLEAEVNRLRERAQICRNTFKQRTAAMTTLVKYLRCKYEDLDRRRLLEAEGFRTDIRMLRERLKALENKMTKASCRPQTAKQRELIESARATLNRARGLELELMRMKSKVAAIEQSE